MSIKIIFFKFISLLLRHLTTVLASDNKISDLPSDTWRCPLLKGKYEILHSLAIRVSKFSKNHFREIFEAHSKLICFREISTIFIIIFAKFSNHFRENFREKFRENVNFRENESLLAPLFSAFP